MEEAKGKGETCDTVVLKRAELCTILGLLTVCSAYGTVGWTDGEDGAVMKKAMKTASSIATLVRIVYGIDENEAIRYAATACSIVKLVRDAGGAAEGESKKPEP